ncbi:MAG: helix-turn-helix domain-containing protein [Candidatus Cybelea sp.]|jgi:AraC-like DNA-binding protein
MMAAPAHEPSDIAVERRDTALGSWTVARWSPPPASPLHDVVEQIWYFDGTLALARERVFPDGRAELIVQLDQPHRDGGSASLDSFPAVCINGLRTRPSVVVAPKGRCRVLGIRFDPAGVYSILQASPQELVDVTIDLHDGIGRSAAELGERCAGAAETSAWNPARNAAAAVLAAQRWLLQRTGREPVADSAIAWTAAMIRNANGVISVGGLGEHLALSRTRLAQRFLERTGVTPKRFARIVRFHNALSLLGRSENIASTAAETGYYDQAHMYRDFAEFARMTPGEFLAATRYPNSASVAER